MCLLRIASGVVSTFFKVLSQTNWKSCPSHAVIEVSRFCCHAIARKHPYRAGVPHFQLHLVERNFENKKEYLLNYSVNTIFPVCRSPEGKKPEVKA